MRAHTCSTHIHTHRHTCRPREGSWEVVLNGWQRQRRPAEPLLGQRERQDECVSCLGHQLSFCGPVCLKGSAQHARGGFRAPLLHPKPVKSLGVSISTFRHTHWLLTPFLKFLEPSLAQMGGVIRSEHVAGMSFASPQEVL